MNKIRIEVIEKSPIRINKKGLSADHELYQIGRIFSIETGQQRSELEWDKIIQEVFVDPITQDYSWNKKPTPVELPIKINHYLETSLKPGVTDNTAASVNEALSYYGLKESEVHSGEIFGFVGSIEEKILYHFAAENLFNPLIQSATAFSRLDPNRFLDLPQRSVKLEKTQVIEYDLTVSDEEVLKLNKDNCWALQLEELHQIRQHFQSLDQNERSALGLPSNPTDVEVEVFAQTWSEHCKHKIFASEIEYTETSNQLIPLGEGVIKGLFKNFIKKSTDELIESGAAPWLVSVFTDNAGIVRFDPKIDLCIKVETHNSPSALDPYGGAITGILGVNRDILGCGIGARPIANTDVFCFAHRDLIDKKGIELPKGLKHPQQILEGVHRGVKDGGNKSGIPTVNGAIYYDDQYAGKPLVYVGTLGALPPKTEHYPDTSHKGQKPGDRVFMVGGKIGADGIHGATFSSMELDESAPASAVQIGDPLTQKRVTDFLLQAQSLGLYSSVTDNGAGGLSSSVGEMAETTGGATIDLALCPTKYPGLSPFQLMISESQERMTFSVPVAKVEEFETLARSLNVEATNIGEFTDNGKLKIFYSDECVANIDIEFLHNGLKPMKLKAHFTGPDKSPNPFRWHGQDFRKVLPKLNSEVLADIILDILAAPNIASKEEWVRQYDHEVQAATVGKPFEGKNSGPCSGGVISLAPHGGENQSGVAIACGLNPKISSYDGHMMAIYAVDEAVRNLICSGANPDYIALLDNFCWPDPVLSPNNPDAEAKMACLVRSCKALYDITTAYKMPLVSGKDSMKNDYIGHWQQEDKQVKISVPPTLLVTGIGKVDDIHTRPESCFQKEEDLIYILGPWETSYFTPSEFTYNYICPEDQVVVPEINLERQLNLYRAIHQAGKDRLIRSINDISDGGLATALLEQSIGNSVAFEVELPEAKTPALVLAQLFNEPAGCFVVSVPPERRQEFENLFASFSIHEIGQTTQSQQCQIKCMNTMVEIPLGQAVEKWRTL